MREPCSNGAAGRVKRVAWADQGRKLVRKRMWIADTGCPLDLTSRLAIPEKQKGDTMPAQSPIALETANGKAAAKYQAPMEIAALKEEEQQV